MPRPSSAPTSLALLTLSGLLLVGSPERAAATPALDLPRLCDSSTPLTVLGLDSASGTLLLSIPNPQPEALGGATSLLIELVPGSDVALVHASTARGRTGGSFGPGPIVSGVPCGADCLQVERWRGAGAATGKSPWEPVGEPLPLGATMSFAATYDGSGALWILLQQLGAAGAAPTGWAYRWSDREWHDAGRIATLALAVPPLQPSPDRPEAVVAGAAVFAVGQPPSYWVKALPTGSSGAAAARRGQLVALPGGAAGYFDADGNLYQSADGGGAWNRLLWTPWQSGTVQIWQRGTDYATDLAGGRRDAFEVVWFDERDAAAPRVWLSSWRAGAPAPQVVWSAPGAVKTDLGDSLPVVEVVQRRTDEWVLLSGCISTPGGAGLGLRTVVGGEVSGAQLVLLRPAPGGG